MYSTLCHPTQFLPLPAPSFTNVNIPRCHKQCPTHSSSSPYISSFHNFQDALICHIIHTCQMSVSFSYNPYSATLDKNKFFFWKKLFQPRLVSNWCSFHFVDITIVTYNNYLLPSQLNSSTSCILSHLILIPVLPLLEHFRIYYF